MYRENWKRPNTFVHCLYISFTKVKKKCVFTVTSKKSRVGRSALIFFFFFVTIGKIGNSRSRFRYFILEIFGKPSFVEAVYDELRTFSTLFALNFDEKLAVE